MQESIQLAQEQARAAKASKNKKQKQRKKAEKQELRGAAEAQEDQKKLTETQAEKTQLQEQKSAIKMGVEDTRQKNEDHAHLKELQLAQAAYDSQRLQHMQEMAKLKERQANTAQQLAQQQERDQELQVQLATASGQSARLSSLRTDQSATGRGGKRRTPSTGSQLGASSLASNSSKGTLTKPTDGSQTLTIQGEDLTGIPGQTSQVQTTEPSIGGMQPDQAPTIEVTLLKTTETSEVPYITFSVPLLPGQPVMAFRRLLLKQISKHRAAISCDLPWELTRMHWNDKDSNGPGQEISSDASTLMRVRLPDVGSFGATLLLSHHPTNPLMKVGLWRLKPGERLAFCETGRTPQTEWLDNLMGVKLTCERLTVEPTKENNALLERLAQTYDPSNEDNSLQQVVEHAGTSLNRRQFASLLPENKISPKVLSLVVRLIQRTHRSTMLLLDLVRYWQTNSSCDDRARFTFQLASRFFSSVSPEDIMQIQQVCVFWCKQPRRTCRSSNAGV